MPDAFECRVGLVQQLGVVKAQHRDAVVLSEHVVALGVVGEAVWGVVLGAIEFDRQPGGRAVEIEHEAVNRMLPPEAPATEPRRPQVLPQHALGLSHLLPQPPRRQQQRPIDGRRSPDPR